ncbi:zinc ribbon domain-containing protein [Chloroflexota bacterium]
MPIYEFKCRDCSEVSEILCLSSEGHTFVCPECGSSNMERLISSSYLVKASPRASGKTCCGREERCETPACSTGESCHSH